VSLLLLLEVAGDAAAERLLHTVNVRVAYEDAVVLRGRAVEAESARSRHVFSPVHRVGTSAAAVLAWFLVRFWYR